MDRPSSPDSRGSSDRTFGLVFAGLFLFAAVLDPWGAYGALWWVGGALAAVALAAPSRLAPLNRAWTAFGLLLHRIMAPVALGMVFFAVVTPVGLLMRVFGKDPMRRSFEREASSYWIDRTDRPSSMDKQF